MIALRIKAISFANCSSRSLITCACLCDKYVTRQTKIMQKLMTGSTRKRKNWVQSGQMANSFVSPYEKSFRQGAQSTRRVNVLNKLLMTKVTDLMSTGELSDILYGKGITITKVKVSMDYSFVNVYWLAKVTSEDEEIQKLLVSISYKLHHELTRLNIMGLVPKIFFVKDKKLALIEEVDECLKKLGLEKLSEEAIASLKSEPISHLSLPRELQEAANFDSEADEKEEEDEEKEDEDPLPPMDHNVLGLNHYEIMKRLEKDVTKSKALHRTCGDSLKIESKGELEEQICIPPADSEKSVKSEVALYIRKQKIMKKKQIKKFQKEEKNFEELNVLYDNEVERDTNDYIIEDTDVEVSMYKQRD